MNCPNCGASHIRPTGVEAGKSPIRSYRCYFCGSEWETEEKVITVTVLQATLPDHEVSP